MKLEFSDKLAPDNIQILFEPDNLTGDLTIKAGNSTIKWSVNMEIATWGIDSINYQLTHLLIPINIDHRDEDDVEEEFLVYADIAPHYKEKGYFCRLYQDVLKDNAWHEEEWGKFPIQFFVEENPSNESHNRSQICVKYIELDLNSETKKLTLTI